MREYTTYECDECGNKSKSYYEIASCEADHLGLSLENWSVYVELIKRVEKCRHTVDTGNYMSKWIARKTINELVEFEKIHNIAKRVV